MIDEDRLMIGCVLLSSAAQCGENAGIEGKIRLNSDDDIYILEARLEKGR
jgi:hypothetical protein